MTDCICPCGWVNVQNYTAEEVQQKVVEIQKKLKIDKAILSASVRQIVARSVIITKTCPCNIQFFLALKIEIFQLKNIDIFLIVAQNIDCGYTLEPPRQGGSNEYPQSMFWSKNKKKK